MDPYDIGRNLGLVYWPLLLGVGIYLVGWAISLPRLPHSARNTRSWFKFFAVVAALAMVAALLYFHYIGQTKT
jgi:hypothetical protein